MIPEEEAIKTMRQDYQNFQGQLVIYPGKKRWLQIAMRSFIKKQIPKRFIIVVHIMNTSVKSSHRCNNHEEIKRFIIQNV